MNEQYDDLNQEDVTEQDIEAEDDLPISGYIDDPEEYVKKTGKPVETFRSKEKYNEFGQLREEIKSLREDVTKWRTTAQAMGTMYTDMDKKAYERAYSDLQNKMFEASQDGDVEAYKHYNQEMQQLSWQDQQKRMSAQQEALANVEAQFSDKNRDWYNESNPSLVKKAQILFKKYLASSPNTNLADILQLVEDEIREFHLPAKAKATSPPNIPRGISNTNKSAHTGRVKIPPELKTEFNTFKDNMARMGITDYSEADFLEYKRKYGEL